MCGVYCGCEMYGWILDQYAPSHTYREGNVSPSLYLHSAISIQHLHTAPGWLQIIYSTLYIIPPPPTSACYISQFHIAPHELKKIAQAKKSIPFYVIKRAKNFFFRFFHFLGCLWAPKNIYPRKKFKFLRGPPEAPPL